MPLGWDGILDGEILGWRDVTVLPFIALQGRLGRKSPSAAIQADVPVILVAFDALAVGLGGDHPVEPLLRLPLTERRARLDALDLPTVDAGGRFARSHLVVATDVDALEAAFTESRARRNEGLMVKDPDSRYAPGRRGLGWLKMKKALATIDCVVVGVEVGHGKRHGVLSDYTFAVRDTEADRLVNIGKAYTAKALDLCVADDPVCSGQGGDPGAHGQYAINGMADQAATFATDHVSTRT